MSLNESLGHVAPEDRVRIVALANQQLFGALLTALYKKGAIDNRDILEIEKVAVTDTDAGKIAAHALEPFIRRARQN